MHDDHYYDYRRDPADILYAEDFYEVRHHTKNRFLTSMGKIGVGIAISTFVLGFAALTVFASLPQLTPEEIVQMEGYNGPTKQKTLFFNLASLRDCDSLGNCNSARDISSQAIGAVAKTGNTAVASTTMAKQQLAKSPRQSDSMNYREIPAIAAPDPQTRGQVQLVEAADKASTDEKSADTSVTQWKVKQQWSIVRETPGMDGAIVTSLAADTRVRVGTSISVNGMKYWAQPLLVETCRDICTETCYNPFSRAL